MDREWSERIKNNSTALSRAEREFLTFVNANPEHAASLPQKDLALRASVSKPTVISFFRKLGYPDYHSFQESIESFFSTHIDSFRASQEMGKRVANVHQLVDQAIDVEKRTLERIQNSLPADFLPAFAHLVQNCRNTYIAGAGTGHYPAHYLAQRLRRYRITSFLLPQDPTHFVDEFFPLSSRDLLVVFHYADDDEYLLPMLRFARQTNAVSVVISGTIHPDFVAICSWFVHISRGELGFKNSMAAPMTFANLLLLAVEVESDPPVREHLKTLEETRKNWV